MRLHPFAACALLACGAPPPTATVTSSAAPVTGASASASAPPTAATPPAKNPFEDRCPESSPAFTPTLSFEKTRTRPLVLAQGSPRHFAIDAAARTSGRGTVSAKFTYGKAQKDLEGEEVTLFLRDRSCTWRSVETALTDGDGWAHVAVPESVLDAPGVYAAELVVRGDGSRAACKLFAVDEGTPAVVFDVDATLTTSDRAVVEEVLEGKVPPVRPSAKEVVRSYADASVAVVYLTGRPYMLGPTTRAWLRSNGFPEGLVRTTTSLEAAAPLDSGVGAFKQQALRELAAAGLDFRVAYGNAPTDICAYAAIGIDPRRTFILGPHAGEACAGHAPSQALASYDLHVGKTASFLAKP